MNAADPGSPAAAPGAPRPVLHQVRLAGSDRAFDASSGESLLQSALRAGLNLPYGCVQGRCGKCRARLLGGAIRALTRPDFVLPEHQTASGWFLACAHAPDSDLDMEFATVRDPREIAQQAVTARVRRIERPDAEHLLVELRTPRSEPLRFLAGQQMDVAIAGLPARRMYLANCPCDAGRPRLHLRHRDDPFERHCFESLRTGDPVDLRGPHGRLLLPAPPLGPLLFLCWETGFAPVQSLIEQAMALGVAAPLRLLWFGLDQRSHYLRNYCRALADAEDLFGFEVVGGVAGGTLARALQPLIAAAPLEDASVLGVLPKADLGPVRALLKSRGAAAVRIRLDGVDEL